VREALGVQLDMSFNREDDEFEGGS
jgi:hypothetical protein